MSGDPQTTAESGLAPFTKASQPGEQYYDDRTEQVWEVIGWITDPAAILRNLTTGEDHVEVIGCLNAKRWHRVDYSTQDSGTSQEPACLLRDTDRGYVGPVPCLFRHLRLTFRAGNHRFVASLLL